MDNNIWISNFNDIDTLGTWENSDNWLVIAGKTEDSLCLCIGLDVSKFEDAWWSKWMRLSEIPGFDSMSQMDSAKYILENGRDISEFFSELDKIDIV